MNKAKESRSTRRARLIREGKSWRLACLEAGYGISTANRGPKAFFRDSPGIQREFIRLAEEEPYSPDLTHKIAKNRLTKAILEGKSSNVSREIELLGKFKEHDWWVHTGEAQIGIFAALAEPLPPQNLAEYDEESDEGIKAGTPKPEPKQSE